jgi:hypothetical protein
MGSEKNKIIDWKKAMSDPEKNRIVDWKLADGEISPQMDISDRWFKTEDFKWLPTKSEMRTSGLESLMDGWKPKKPFIGPETKVIALGSCFASYFVIWLAEHGFNKLVPQSPYNALIRNAFAFESVSVIAQQFRWAFGEFDSKDALWVEKSKELFEPSEDKRLIVRETLEEIDVLVVTLGLSEVWYDSLSNEPLWRAMPKKYYDPNRHIFRIESLASSLASLQKIDELRERYLPKLKIIYTVSPVRLKATFRPVSAITANSVSKAIVRAALDEFLRSKPNLVNEVYFYFPSYEMVLDVVREPFKEDNRHIQDYVPSQILSVFSKFYTTFDESSGRIAEIKEQPEDEYHRIIDHLEAENSELQRICDDRMAVINELSQAADDRLALIQGLEGTAHERLELIEQLTRIAGERLQVIQILDAEVERFRSEVERLRSEVEQNRKKGIRLWGR